VRKGLAIDSLSLIEAFITAILIVNAGIGISHAVTNEVKEKMTDIHAERIKNAALALSQSPTASIEIQMQGYNFSYNEDKDRFNVSFDDETSSVEMVAEDMNYCTIDVPSGSNKIENTLCINRTTADLGDDLSCGGGYYAPGFVGTSDEETKLKIRGGQC